MRILVLSDIHSNLSALEAVLAHSKTYGKFDVKLCAGDIVGYGPEPNECVQMIKDRGFIARLGNHDRAVIDGSYQGFHIHAQNAVRHNQSVLTKASRSYLENLASLPFIGKEYAMVHGSFAGVGPQSFSGKSFFEDIYIFEDNDAAEAMKALTAEEAYGNPRLGIIGHTHLPTFASGWVGIPKGFVPLEFDTSMIERKEIQPDTSPTLNPETKDWRYISLFNPGSVGQPRGNDPRASYGVVTITKDRIILVYNRVDYNIDATQKKMKEFGLQGDVGFTKFLIDRLSVGR